jgi:hypothetical protein
MSLASFFRNQDIDPTVVTTKVAWYRHGTDIQWTTKPEAWMNLAGEYWWSRKAIGGWIYHYHGKNPTFPQPSEEWLADNRPTKVTHYGEQEPA